MRRSNRDGITSAWQTRQELQMADQLGLQDIDKELLLLKRKREIIEQQQKILANEFQRNDYHQYSHSQSRFDDYVQSYEDYGQSSRKRPIAVWEDEIPTKRFSGPTNSSFGGPRPLLSVPSRYRGSGGGPSRAIRPSRSGPVKRDSNPARATRKPEKANSVPARTKSVGAPRRPPVEGIGNEWNRVRADVEPSRQLNGRLELSLGAIIKQIRLNYPRTELNSPSVIKAIKQSVRERIREVMMGQLVVRVDDITAKYRARYDTDSDLDIVTKAINEYKNKEVLLSKIDDPEKYFKDNMSKITEEALKNMFQKLEELYLGEPRKTNPDASGEAKALAINPLDPKITSQVRYQNLEIFLNAKMASMLKKYVPLILRIMNLDQKYVELKNTVTAEVVEMLGGKKGGEGPVSEPHDSPDVSATSLNRPDSKPQPQNTFGPLPYYAKILGKPGLPKRKLMETFFDEFKPVRVKKHRTMHNLLFAGFQDKESFDKLLAADGRAIGNFKLSIRVSERSCPEQKNTDLNSSFSSGDKIIEAELDAQITDLLSSIRHSEEGGPGEQSEKGDGQNEENADAAENEENAEVSQNAENAKVSQNDENGDAITEDVENADAITEDVENADAVTEDVENADAVTEDVENADSYNKNLENNDENAEEVDAEYNDADIAYTEHVDEPVTENVDGDDETENAETADFEDEDYGTNDAADVETPEDGTEEEEKADQVKALASEALPVATPTRASARLAATPSRIQTRRASRLAQNEK